MKLNTPAFLVHGIAVFSLISFSFFAPQLSIALENSSDQINKINVPSNTEWQKLPHARLRYHFLDSNQLSKSTSNSISALILEIEFEKNWHTYWENPGDSGATPIFEFIGIESKFINGPLLPSPERITMGPITTYGHSNQLFITFELTHNSLPNKFQLDYEILVCKEICIPGTGVLKVNTQQSSPAGKELFEITRQRLPKKFDDIEFSYNQLIDKKLNIDLSNSKSLNTPLYLKDIFLNSNLRNSHTKPTIVQTDETQFYVVYPKEVRSPYAGIAVFVDQNGSEVAARFAADQESSKVFLMFFLAFLGGLILNLMPCVLPILSLKFFSLTKLATEKRTASLAGYILGVLFSFQIIAIILLVLKSSGESIGWGFQLQIPWFLAGLATVFFFMAFNLFGVWDFELPLLGNKSRETNFSGEFLVGLLAVVVASPCTAPFMGVALGYAITQPTISVLTIFLGLGLGLASPFILLLMWKNFKIPFKQGPWMNTFKVFLGFPLIATGLWLVYIYGSITNLETSFWLLGLLTLSSCAVWLIQKYTANHPITRLLLISICFGLIMLGDQLILRDVASQSSSDKKARGSEENSNANSKVQWLPFSENKFQELQTQDKIVFVNFTADWCLSCKVNEAVTFQSSQVAEFINNQNITMLKADWTKKDAEIARILKSYGRIGVPLYLLYLPKTGSIQVLPELLTPEIFLRAFKK